MKVLLVFFLALSVLCMLGCIAIGLLTEVSGRAAFLGFAGCSIVASELANAWWKIERAEREDRR